MLLTSTDGSDYFVIIEYSRNIWESMDGVLNEITRKKDKRKDICSWISIPLIKILL